MLIILLKFIIITYVLSDLSEFIGEFIEIYDSKHKIVNIIKTLLVYLFSCNKCFAFWFTILLTHNLLLAACVSIIIEIVKKIINKYNKTYL